jgi:hypothetical protein
MKKFISSIILTAAISSICLSCSSNKTVDEKIANKTISMAVFTSSNYASKIYEGTTAGLEITVKKAQKNKETVVLEKTFPAIPLQSFPDALNAFKNSIKVSNVRNDDAVEISYILTYNSNGSVVKMQSDEVVSGEEQSDTLNINI